MNDRKKIRALLAGALLLTACLAITCGREGPEAPPDTVPPTITSTSPYYNEQNVPLNASVKVSFNEAMSSASISDKSLMLLQANTGVAGTASCNGETAVFKPAVNLIANTLYTVRVTIEVQDAAGNALVVPYEYSFRTGTTVSTGTHTIKASAGPNGSIIPSGQVSVDDGMGKTFTITPDSKYHVVTPVGGTCGGTLSGTQYTTNAVSGDCTVIASFAANAVVEHTVTATAGPNGTIEPGSASVPDGQTYEFTVDPATDYQSAVTGCDGSLSGLTYRTGPITKPCEVVASFTPVPPPPVIKHTISASADGNGTITPSGDIEVIHGVDQSFTINAHDVFIISEVKVDGKEVKIGRFEKTFTYTFRNVDENHTITASFRRFWQIGSSTEGNGSISPPGVVNVVEGESQAFDVIPAPDNSIEVVLVDGNSVGPVPTYLFPNVTSNHSIWARFQSITPIYRVTATAYGRGTVVPQSQPAENGAQVQFTLAPVEGFHVAIPIGGTCGGTWAEPILTYTTGPITGDCTVEVNFEADQPVPTDDFMITPEREDEEGTYYINIPVVEQAGESLTELSTPQALTWKIAPSRRLSAPISRVDPI